jgi:hypothetical protein
MPLPTGVSEMIRKFSKYMQMSMASEEVGGDFPTSFLVVGEILSRMYKVVVISSSRGIHWAYYGVER